MAVHDIGVDVGTGSVPWRLPRTREASCCGEAPITPWHEPCQVVEQKGQVDRCGALLGVRLSPANPHDSLMPDAVSGEPNGRGRSKKRPNNLRTDNAYGHRRCDNERRAPSILPRIAQRGAGASERLRRHFVMSSYEV